MTELMTQEGRHSAILGTSPLDGAMIIDRPDPPPHVVSVEEMSIGLAIGRLRGTTGAIVRDDGPGRRMGGIGDIEARAREGAADMTVIRTCQFPGVSPEMSRTCRSLSLMTWIGKDKMDVFLIVAVY